MKIGFIGTGIMGAPMAQNLQSAGHELLLYKHRSPAPANLIDAGATVLENMSELAENADVVITMLPDTNDVESAIFGTDGLSNGLSVGKMLIDMSSINPQSTQAIARELEKKGVEFLDAPVSGGEIGARNASLTIMVGGTLNAYNRALPLLGLMGKAITHVGPVGHGQIAKISNQIVVALSIQAVAEGLLFASRAGADVAAVRSALMHGFAASKALEVHGQRMIERNFDPGFRIDLHSKDLAIALENARSVGVALPATALAQQLFNACKGMGGGSWDHSALVSALEQISGHCISQPCQHPGQGVRHA